MVNFRVMVAAVLANNHQASSSAFLKRPPRRGVRGTSAELRWKKTHPHEDDLHELEQMGFQKSFLKNPQYSAK